MFSAIPSHYYSSPKIFEEEYERLFKRGWIFAGFAAELRNNKDFITFDLFGQSIVLQNFEGEIKAFQNVCTHRFNKLQHESFGNRPLLCNYHFWGYDKDGFPRSVPKKSSFDFTPEQMECLKLKQYPVDKCGDFLFLRLDDNGDTLQEFLGDYAAEIAQVSGHLGEKFSSQDVPHEANWKLLIENVLECYHCSSVHANSFFKMGFGQRSPENIVVKKLHSSCDFPKTETKPTSKRKVHMAYLEERSLKHASYKHYYIFPNLVVSSTEGLTFYVGQLLPVNAVHTVLRTRLFDCQLSGSHKPLAVHNFFQEEAANISKNLLAEDKEVVEAVQKGITQVNKYAYLGTEEIRIANFHQKYLEFLGTSKCEPKYL